MQEAAEAVVVIHPQETAVLAVQAVVEQEETDLLLVQEQ
jgi:hypothetical protein